MGALAFMAAFAWEQARKEGSFSPLFHPFLASLTNADMRHAGAFFFGATGAPAQKTQPDIWPKRQTVAWHTFLLMSHVLIGYRPSSFFPCAAAACFISVQPSLCHIIKCVADSTIWSVVVSICALPLCVRPDVHYRLTVCTMLNQLVSKGIWGA